MMKRMVLLGILFFVSRLQAQEIAACYDKTVNIIFPFAIASEDHGSNGIIVQQRKGAAQILHVKANQKNFSPTSLSVVTTDGKFYSFVVRFAGDVAQLNYVVNPQEAVTVTTIPHNQQILERDGKHVVHAEGSLHIKSRDNLSVLQVRGLYASKHALWLKAKLANRAAVDFVPSFVKFFIRSKRRAKNAAIEEREILPVYRQTTDVVEGKTVESFVFAFDPFVITSKQRLVIQVGEQNGRLIQLYIKPRHFRRMAKIDQSAKQ